MAIEDPSLFEDPLLSVLRQHAAHLRLGGKEDVLDRAALRKDLDKALRRNSVRYYCVLAIMVGVFLLLLLLTYLKPESFNAKWLLGGTGIFAGGFGTALAAIARSWWRTDTLLTVCKYANEQSMALIIQSILKAETAPRSARQR